MPFRFLIVGCGSIGERHRVLELAADAKAVGARAAVVTASYHFGWNAAEIEGFFRHIANVAPRTSVELYNASVHGDLAEAKRLQGIYNRLFEIFFLVDRGSGSIAGALGGLKVGLELLGIAPSRVRSPGRQASDEGKARVAELLRQIPETAERLEGGRALGAPSTQGNAGRRRTSSGR